MFIGVFINRDDKKKYTIKHMLSIYPNQYIFDLVAVVVAFCYCFFFVHFFFVSGKQIRSEPLVHTRTMHLF